MPFRRHPFSFSEKIEHLINTDTFPSVRYTISMRFVKANQQAAEDDITRALVGLLEANSKALWLVSGGSNIAIQTDVMKRIPDDLSAKLVITPMDERFGPFGHTNSNSAQLRLAGFNPKKGQFIDILRGASSGGQAAEQLIAALKGEHAIIATFGIGTDGHTAGILPGSQAITANEPVICYKAADYTRITITPGFMPQINIAFACAFGPAKTPAIERLAAGKASITDTPAIVLANIHECTIYNDTVEQEDK